MPDLCGVHAPTLYEFSLVEDLATGSSIYKHKYHEKAAAMEVRMSEFARRLVASLAGPEIVHMGSVINAILHDQVERETDKERMKARASACFSCIHVHLKLYASA